MTRRDERDPRDDYLHAAGSTTTRLELVEAAARARGVPFARVVRGEITVVYDPKEDR